MLPELTPAVTRVLEEAQRSAYHLGMSEVLSVHLLNALLAEEEGRACSLAIAAGLDVSAFRASRAIPPQPNPPPPGNSGDIAPSPLVGEGWAGGAQTSALPMHPRTRSALLAARDLARELSGESIIGSDALLLALLRGDDTLTAELVSFGLRMEELESTMLAQSQPPPEPEEPLHLSEHTEQMEASRLLDACANRAREGLRVLEDYCRFVLDDTFLCRSLKELRHDLTAALAELSPSLLLQSRDTQGDVGVELSTPSEQQRASLREVVQANWKRLQESLRSLEEYGKVYSVSLGQALEQLRYRTYTLERALVLGVDARQRLQRARLYVLLTGSKCVATLDWIIAEVAAGGADIIQLREKNKSDRELLERARQVRHWTRQAGVLFILNDRVDIARLVEADGVHLGQEDMPVQEARRILGPEALIGVSTHNLEQLRQAILDGASYVGIGPTFSSDTKEFAELAGLEFVHQAMAETTLPAFIIGGINTQTVGAAVTAGARRLAVSAAIAKTDDPRAVCISLLAALPVKA